MALTLGIREELLPLLQRYGAPFMTTDTLVSTIAEIRPTASTVDMRDSAANFVGAVNDANRSEGGASCCSTEDAIRMVASYPEGVDELFRRLEKHIEIPARFFKGGGKGKTNPVYEKTSMGYGSKPVAAIHQSAKWFGLNGQFSKTFTGGMPTASGLTTSSSHSRVHSSLDGADGAAQ